MATIRPREAVGQGLWHARHPRPPAFTRRPLAFAYRRTRTEVLGARLVDNRATG